MIFEFESFSETKAAFNLVADAVAGATNLDRVVRSHGAEEIVTDDGDVIRFRTRTGARKACSCSCT